HIGRDRATPYGNQSGDWLVLIFRKQEHRGIPLTIQLQNLGIVLPWMDEEAIPLSRFLIQIVEGVDIFRLRSLTYLNLLARSQSNIVAPLFLHCCQQFFFTGTNIEHPGATWMSSEPILAETKLTQLILPARVAIWYIGLHLEHKCAAPTSFFSGSSTQS